VRGATRTITVLFTDMVGSTNLLSRLGPDAGDDLLNRHFAALRGALAVHRGHEVKTLGDGVMAVFDSAGDALGCAVTMQRGVERQGRSDPERSFEMRVGLSAGEVFQENGDFIGMPVVEASRLCAAACPGQILTADVVRALVGGTAMVRLEPIGQLTLKGLPAPVDAWEVDWDAAEDSSLRVALAEDSVLLREGLARVLEAEGIEVVLQASDADTLMAGLTVARPHVAVLDVRMPPTHTTEGLDAAEQIRSDHPEIGILLLSAEVQPSAARRLLEGASEGVGYLLKERVGDIGELLSAIRTVAGGGSAIDPEVVAQLTPAGT
jgi:class 3 adenylate cyclase